VTYDTPPRRLTPKVPTRDEPDAPERGPAPWKVDPLSISRPASRG